MCLFQTKSGWKECVRACVCARVCACVRVRQLKHLQMALVLPHQELITQTWGRCRYASQKPKSGVCIYAHRFVTRGVCCVSEAGPTRNMSQQKSTKPFTKFSAIYIPLHFFIIIKDTLWNSTYYLFFLFFFSYIIYIIHTHTHTIIINTHI